MRSMARAEPATIVACFADRHAPQVCAHAEHDQPFGFLDAVGVLLWVAEDGQAIKERVMLVTPGDGLQKGVRSTYLTLSASLISSSVRWRMKTGFPRHLIITFLPSGMAARSTSTFAWASTSAEADMFCKKSVGLETESQLVSVVCSLQRFVANE
jgi:hypothetical protein